MAEDKKLNDLTAVSDYAYKYVETADGSQAKISKADDAAVVAGILSANKQFPFMYLGSAATDLNLSLDSGFYRLAGNSYTNSPSNSLYGVLITFKDSESYVSQIIIDRYSSKMWFRGGVYTEGVFEDWVQL